jgi:hypothetical protein
MFFGITRSSHLLSEKGTKPGTVQFVDKDIRSPFGDMVWGVFGQAASHARHKPRRSMIDLVVIDF